MSSVNWQRILATTDFSALGNSAIGCARDLAEKFGAELHVLHVAENVDEVARAGGATGLLEPADAADERWGWLAALHGETGTVRRIDTILVGKDVPGQIVHYAEKHGIDLIVMASHGRTGFRHLILGSVTEKVIRSVHCPVLVLRAAVAGRG